MFHSLYGRHMDHVEMTALEEKMPPKLLTLGQEANFVKILKEEAFAASFSEVEQHTLLDVARLANIWNLVQMVGPGIFLEIGTFRGGTALHICNAMEPRNAAFYCFDPFERAGFENMSEVDEPFRPDRFTETRFDEVVELLSSKPNAKVVQGFFPAAADGLNLQKIAFCHLDVDIYDATLRSLEYVSARLATRALIVVDDYGRTDTPGVDKAVTDFVAANPSFLVLPIFPIQAVLMPKWLWLADY